MKDRFTLENLPLSFLNDFHDIETDDIKQALIDLVNVMYDDYDIEEVQEMFSTFTTTMYEVYELFLYNRDIENLDLLIEVMLFCASQLETYKVRKIYRAHHKSNAKVLNR